MLLAIYVTSHGRLEKYQLRSRTILINYFVDIATFFYIINKFFDFDNNILDNTILYTILLDI